MSGPLKISELPDGGSPQVGDEIPVRRANANVRVLLGNCIGPQGDPGADGQAGPPGTTDYLQLSNLPNLSQVATSGSYGDLTGKPALAAVATTGAYGSLTGVPTLGTVASTAASTWALANHTHAGGSDPWTYVVLGSHFWTSSASAVNVPSFSFTATTSVNYEVEGQLLCRTSSATIGPRPGFSWPANLTDGIGTLWLTSAAGTQVLQNGNKSAAVLAPVGGLPNTSSWPAQFSGVLLASASTSGNLQMQLASESSTIFVGLMAGSFLKYRTYT